MDTSNFTQRTRRVLMNAQHEAQQLGHAHVGSEHLLLALLQEDNCVANAVLDNLRVDFTEVRDQVLALAPPSSVSQSHDTTLPYSADGRSVLACAMREAAELKHTYVGTEHLLLGLLRERRGIAAKALEAEGMSPDSARPEVLHLLGHPPGSGHQ